MPQLWRRSTAPLLLFALVLVAVNSLPAAAIKTATEIEAATPSGVAAWELETAQTAEHAPVVFAPLKLSSGGLVEQPAASFGDGRMSPGVRAVKAVVPPIAAEPELRESSAFSAIHVVADGETLGAIAERYNVPVTALAAANAVDPRLLPAGLKLRIPQTPGMPHVVHEGETVETIAAQYGVPVDTVRGFASNRLDNSRTLTPGEELFVPGALPPGLPAEDVLAGIPARTVGVVRDDKTNLRSGPATGYQRLGYLGSTTPVILLGQHNGWIKLLTVEGSEGWVAAELLLHGAELAAQLPIIDDIPPLPTPPPAPPAPPAPAEPPRPVDRWVWPASGDFTSGFGYRNMRVGTYHNGIDIANGRGTPIRAARAGRVTAAGWCGGYGYCVKIDHGDGFVTEYGHMYAAPVVGVGEFVEAGQRIGGMGKTYGRGGYATGVHLHFTVKLNGKAVNPLRYLP